MRAVSHDLALAVGQITPERLCVGTGKLEADFGLWRDSRPMVDGDDSDEVRGLVAAAARLERAA